MSRRGELRPAIDAATVYAPNGDGDLEPTEWVRLVVPADLVRVATLPDGSEAIELHVLALNAILSRQAVRDRLRKAVQTCRCPYRVIRPEDCE